MTSTVKILLQVLSTLGILAWGAAVFVGLHFYSGCSFAVSIPSALVTALLMYFFLSLARQYAQPKTEGNYGALGKVKKWGFFGVYCLVSLLSALFVAHAVFCTTVMKSNVQARALETLDGIVRVTGDANTQGSYLEYVDQMLADYRNANPNAHTKADLLDAELADLNDHLTVNSHYSDIKREMTDYWQYADGSVRDWNWFYVSQYLDEMGPNLTRWQQQLADGSRQGLNKMPEGLFYEYQARLVPGQELDMSDFYTFGGHDFSWQALLLILGLQTVIILSWIAVCQDPTKRATGIGGGGIDGVGTW